MYEKLSKIEDEVTDIVFMQETICRAVYDDYDCMFLYPFTKIISEKLENILTELQNIVPET